LDEAARAQMELTMLRSLIEKYPFVPGLKRILAEKSGNPEWLNMRPPNTSLSDEEGEKLLADLKEALGE